jgi:hypothetical protein
MKYSFSIRCALPLLLLGALPGRGQLPPPDATAPVPLEAPAADSLNRFGLAWGISFNLQVGFKNVGAFAAQTDPGPATGGRFNRTYDDGFNRVDITGNNHGPGYANTTWYWGYESGSQIVPSTGNPQSVVMHSSSSGGAATIGRDDDASPGVEFSYSRELLRHEHWRLGLEGVLGYTELNIEDSAAASAGVSQITDAFAVPASSSGQFLPSPGLGATAQGPGAVIGSAPSRTTSILAGQVAGNRRFRADLFGLRLGPYFEVPLGKKAAFDLSGGFALMYVNSDFSFNETTAVSGLGSISSRASGSHDDLLPGGYVAGAFSYAITRDWTAFAGAQAQDVGTYTHTEGGRQAVLDLRQLVFVTLGVFYSF